MLESRSRFLDVFPQSGPVIGVIHLPPLPGYPASPGLPAVVRDALAGLGALVAGGVDGVLVENDGDQPHRVTAAPETIACMTAVARELVEAAGALPIGVEILLNDPQASLAVALATGARFIRTDYFVDRMTRPEYGGEMAIDPSGLMACRERLGARDVLVLADIQVKHARMIQPRPLAESAALARAHGADGIVVTGTLTGVPPASRDLQDARQGAGAVPVLVGSGLDETNASALMPAADGAIVGTSLKTGAHVDPDKVRRLMEHVRAARASGSA
ncbi:MAG: BtpA/SgcQ family protein [Acidobacteria bacterium]|nr:BtpA/SgcQ family protein [Acidobacteriota bacterium]